MLRHEPAKVLIGMLGGLTAAAGALDVAFLDQEGFVHFLDSFRFFAASRCNSA